MERLASNIIIEDNKVWFETGLGTIKHPRQLNLQLEHINLDHFLCGSLTTASNRGELMTILTLFWFVFILSNVASGLNNV
jgi:hypothetical protein